MWTYAEWILFSKKDRSIENIPPTSNALAMHIKRTIYQGGFVWGNITDPLVVLPDPSQWGWKLDDKRWLPNWVTISNTNIECDILVK